MFRKIFVVAGVAALALSIAAGAQAGSGVNSQAGNTLTGNGTSPNGLKAHGTTGEAAPTARIVAVELPPETR